MQRHATATGPTSLSWPMSGYISQLLQGSVFRGLSRFFANSIICWSFILCFLRQKVLFLEALFGNSWPSLFTLGLIQSSIFFVDNWWLWNEIELQQNYEAMLFSCVLILNFSSFIHHILILYSNIEFEMHSLKSIYLPEFWVKMDRINYFTRFCLCSCFSNLEAYLFKWITIMLLSIR